MKIQKENVLMSELHIDKTLIKHALEKQHFIAPVPLCHTLSVCFLVDSWDYLSIGI